MGQSPAAGLLKALAFAARKHRDHRRKGAGSPPFINHAIQVADILANVGGVTDLVTLQAAVLHDTLEDSDTSVRELEQVFGAEVTRVVEEVSDDVRVPIEERRRRQIAHAPSLSDRARLVRLADKIANVRSMGWSPPVGWAEERRIDYLDWASEVVDACRGANPDLENLFDRTCAEVRQILGAPSDSGDDPAGA